MVNLLKTPVRIGGTLFAAALFAMAQGNMARPGMVNYAEGQVTLDGQSIGAKNLGQMEVIPGHTLTTGQGKVEMLLMPGTFLRLGENSAVKMISPQLNNTEVELVKGSGMLEVDQFAKENHLSVITGGITVEIQKTGVYQFNADQPKVSVYDGKAVVLRGERSIDVGKGRELLLQASSQRKPQKFDRKQTDSLYEWSSLRSEYMAEANMASAQMVAVNNYAGWGGNGWYWNSWYDTWSFLPGAGFFYSPFGYGFYSPVFWRNYGSYYYGHGFYGHGGHLAPGRGPHYAGGFGHGGGGFGHGGGGGGFGHGGGGFGGGGGMHGGGGGHGR